MKVTRKTSELSIEVIGADGLKSVGIHLIREGVFFQRKQMTVVIDNVGIRGSPVRPE